MKIKTKRSIDFFIGLTLSYSSLVLAKLLGFILHRDHSLKTPPKNILFVKMLGLGSVVLASDSIYAIRKRYPSARIIMLTGADIKSGMMPTGLFDEIMVIRDNNFLILLIDMFKSLIKCWQLRKLWTVDLEVYSKLTTVFTLFTLAINRFGFILSPVLFRNKINTHVVYFNQLIHVAENYKALAKSLEAEVTEEYQFPNFPLNHRTKGLDYRYIAINNTCSDLSAERKLPLPVLNDICQWILTETNYSLAFTGTLNDRSEIESFIKMLPLEFSHSRVENIAGKYSFADYYSFLYEQCALMITIDSAPLHIARRLGLPTLSLWGPTSPLNLLAANKYNVYHYLNKNCSPCLHLIETLPCKGNNICMKEMNSQHIIEMIKNLIINL